MTDIAQTPTPPYYAVIFTSLRTPGDHGYQQMTQRMLDLAATQPGYLGVESAREEIGITVSYWSNLDAIAQWKAHADHQQAQNQGRDQWYAHYKVRIAKVERDYNFKSLPKG